MKPTTLFLSLSMGLILLSSCGKKNSQTQAVRKNITETVFASGILVPEDQYNLTSLTEGYIVQLHFTEGDAVNEGELLAVIDNEQNDINAKSSDQLLTIAAANTNPNAPALKQTEINLELAKQKYLQDKKQAERYTTLYETNSVSKLEYENMLLNLENSKTNYNALQENYKLLQQQADQQLIIQKSQKELNLVSKEHNKIRAVIGGKVYKKNKELGDYIRKGDVIAVIGNPKNLYAFLSVDESNISKIKLNQKVLIELNTLKTKSYEGIISEIYPAFDELTQSFYCKAEFSDSLDFKISGTQLTANIIIGNKENVLVIPRNYLGYGNKVNVKDSGIISVETGFISNDWVEIKSGIDEESILLTEKK